MGLFYITNAQPLPIPRKQRWARISLVSTLSGAGNTASLRILHHCDKDFCPRLHFQRINFAGHVWKFGSLYVYGKLPTYPSPKPTLSVNVGVGEGLVDSFPETYNDDAKWELLVHLLRKAEQRDSINKQTTPVNTWKDNSRVASTLRLWNRPLIDSSIAWACRAVGQQAGISRREWWTITAVWSSRWWRHIGSRGGDVCHHGVTQ